MTKFVVKSKKFGTVTFTHFAENSEWKTSPIWADVNGREETLGIQCLNKGSSILVTEDNARKLAYRWLRKMQTA